MTAHNQMNFGNYMFGVAGQAMGFTLAELQAGAHKNSKYPEDRNGNRIESGQPNANKYPPQWDSADDQFSIGQGFSYGEIYEFDETVFRASSE